MQLSCLRHTTAFVALFTLTIAGAGCSSSSSSSSGGANDSEEGSNGGSENGGGATSDWVPLLEDVPLPANSISSQSNLRLVIDDDDRIFAAYVYENQAEWRDDLGVFEYEEETEAEGEPAAEWHDLELNSEARTSRANPVMVAGASGFTLAYHNGESGQLVSRSYNPDSGWTAETVISASMTDFSSADGARHGDTRYLAIHDGDDLRIWESEGPTLNTSPVIGPADMDDSVGYWSIAANDEGLHLAHVTDTSPGEVAVETWSASSWTETSTLEMPTLDDQIPRLAIAGRDEYLYLAAVQRTWDSAAVDNWVYDLVIYEVKDTDLEQLGPKVIDEVELWGIPKLELHIDDSGAPVVFWSEYENIDYEDYYFARLEDNDWALFGDDRIEDMRNRNYYASAIDSDNIPYVNYLIPAIRNRVIHYTETD